MKRVLISVLAILALGALAIPVAATTFSQAADGCVDDADDPEAVRGDVLRFCAAVADGQASFAIDVEEVVDPNTDSGWSQEYDTSWSVALEVTGDTEPDYTMWYSNEDGFGVSTRVLAEDMSTTCQGEATFESNRYVAAGLDIAECFGGATTIRATSAFGYFNESIVESDDSPAVTPGSALPAALGTVGPTEEPTEEPTEVPTESPEPSAFRLEGPTRSETSIAISEYQFPEGSRDVYLARQDVFADSISSGSLTNGPILLVPLCGTVPPTVLDEITRLAPENVIGLGGVAAVCDQVLDDALEAAS